MGSTWFLISDTIFLRQHKLQCSSSDISVPYILINKRKPNFTNCSSSENDKKRTEFMCDNLGEDEKEQLKK